MVCAATGLGEVGWGRFGFPISLSLRKGLPTLPSPDPLRARTISQQVRGGFLELLLRRPQVRQVSVEEGRRDGSQQHHGAANLEG